MDEISEPYLGYIVCLTTEDGPFVGGVLITDRAGLPLEFRHTDPISPTRLQRVLYGRVLDSYMYNEVVIGALLEAVEGKPQLYVVGDGAYLSGAGRYETPAVWLSEARNIPAKAIGTRHDLSNEEFVLELGPSNGPIRVKLDPRANARGPAAAVRESASKVLTEASQSMELVEPLRRVEDALTLLCEAQAQISPRLAA